MVDEKQPGAPTPSTAPGAANGSVVNERDEHVVSIDLERMSSADDSLELAATDDIESQTQLTSAAGGKELQSSDDGFAADGSDGSHGKITSVGSQLMSKWRWIGQRELQYLVTNRRTRPPRPEGQPSAIELGNESDCSSSAAAPVVAEGDAPEKGAFVRVVTEGAGIPASLEGGSEGGRQRIAHILLPTEAESPERDKPGNPEHPSPRSILKGEELPVVTAATAPATATGGKKRKVASVFGDHNPLSPGQDIEKRKVNDEVVVVVGGGARVGDAAEATADGYHHQDDDDETLCRVCHQIAGKADVINLGCACKLDLGRAHKGCAEIWFQVRGNRQCEICGEIAQNVQLLEPMDDTPANTPETVITVTVQRPVHICLQNRPLRNVLLVFIVAAFLIPWLFRFACSSS